MKNNNCESLPSLQEFLKSIIVKSQKLMTIKLLNLEYMRLRGQFIPYQFFGFYNLEVFLKSIPETLEVQGYGSSALVSIEQIKSPTPTRSLQIQSKNSANLTCKGAVPRIANNKNIYAMDPAKNFVVSHVVPRSIPTDFSSGKSFPITITKIFNPEKFWFNINTDEFPLANLENKLQQFYSNLMNDEYCNNCPLIGQYGAVQCKGKWYRARIINVTSTEIKVNLLDYGKVEYVPANSIKFLLKNFTKLPAQAFRGSLSHLQPIDGEWKKESVNFFLKLTQHANLFGKITAVNTEQTIIYMILYSPNCENIQKNFILHGHAKFNENWLSSDKKDCKLVLDDNAYPTFYLLEEGVDQKIEEKLKKQMTIKNDQQLIDEIKLQIEKAKKSSNHINIDVNKILTKIINDDEWDVDTNTNNPIKDINLDKFPWNLPETNPFRIDLIQSMQENM